MIRCFQSTKSQQSALWASVVYEDMKKYYSPEIATMNTVLDILIRFNDIEQVVKQFFEDISLFKLSPNTRSYNIIIRGLANHGQIEAAEKIYREMRSGVISMKPLVSTYSTLIGHYTKNGMNTEADSILDDMLQDSVKPNAWIFNTLINRFVRQKDYVSVKRVMSLMKESDVKPDVATYSTLIEGYAKDGNEEAIAEIQAQMALNHIYPNQKTITSTIKVFAKSRIDQDIDKHLGMILESLPTKEMNELTFGVLMNVYGKRRDMNAAIGIYNHMVSKKREPNDVIVCSLLDGYIRSGEVMTANQIFHEHYTARGIRPPSAWSYSIMITGFCRNSNLESALHYYHQMNNFQIAPDATICSRLIQLYLEHHQLDNAENILRLMRNSRMDISVHTYTMLIDYTSNTMNFRSALRYYQEMLDAGIKPDVHCYTVLINTHIRAKCFTECDSTFEQMIMAKIKPTLETLTSMLKAHSLRVDDRQVKKYWNIILDMGLLPDVKSFTVLMQTYSQQGNTEMVEYIFREITQKRIEVDAVTLTTMIKTYGGLPKLDVRRIDEITSILEEKELKPIPDYYQSLLGMFGQHKMHDRVVRTWRNACGLEQPLDWVPTTSNFVYLIEACRDRGYIDDLHSVWNAATRRNFGGTRPSDASPELMSLARTSFTKPAPEVFVAYLNALLTHNRFEEIERLLGEECHEMRMIPSNEAFEVLFVGLAQYDFLNNELESIRRVVVDRWPKLENTIDKIIEGTRKIGVYS
ncbi:hypothetical protein BGZ76_008227 [Entomortierella beljakovae]|nr:hypothetical protein BGZ76_008227 [Entomortierella beljakovae]